MEVLALSLGFVDNDFGVFEIVVAVVEVADNFEV